ncbi:hypothetical protein JW960_01160 [candidate division KSB1 bacterium]|nr:hypothetical protein [candidate division KSB1 bacterium]
MNKYFFLLISILFIVCRQHEDRGGFKWKGTINGVKANWDIACDDQCINCYATHPFDSTLENIALASSTYKDVYDRCKELPARWRVIDTTDTNVIPTGKVWFTQSADVSFGFDGWRGTKTKDTISYISLAAGCSTTCNILIDSTIKNSAYDKIVAVLPISAMGVISFSKSRFLDTINLTGTENTFKLYSLNSSTDNISISLSVLGISDPKSPACLAGDCYGSSDKLKVVVYKEKTFSKRYNVYLVSNPTFRPTANEWRTNFNSILKQAVAKLGDSIYVYDLSDRTSEWDLNKNNKVDFLFNNGMLDYFQYDNGSLIAQEEWHLAQAARGLIGDDKELCDESANHATFLSSTRMRTHWVLNYTYYRNSSDSLKIRLAGALGLSKNIVYRIGQYNDTLQDSPGHYESILIREIYEDGPTSYILLFNPLTKNYDRKDGITLYTDEFSISGDTPPLSVNDQIPADCSFCMANALNYVVIVHEFLHQNSAGFFRHVTNDGTEDANPPSKGNIMHRTDNVGTKLAYRLLTIPNNEPNGGTKYSQWAKMHNF